MKTVLFIPGFLENINSRDYKSTLRAIEAKGYRTEFVPIKWQRTTLTDWVKELNEFYSGYDPAETILAGFSFGAITAFMTASRQNPAELWLFSLSPYFSDDMPNVEKIWLKYIGQRRANVFRTLDFDLLAKSIRCRTHLFIGEVEFKKYPDLAKRVVATHRLIKNSSLTIVPDADHDVADKRYMASIQKIISTELTSSPPR